ncbi:NAD(P)H-hydrate dehydratase [Aeromicrobium sp. SMF47]|uniref:ADP-dependent (S)-NAD(P)H-hydrate dehydratase n=1 Tax=Aeromicrobium yanjiei TaxID=2662028 RepID=A0A5Q2MLR9_9ACTN|nr:MULTISPECIES: NAD(P)H-hydrate dehydratase [Aeromicrobium]MRJ76168.1 NAD(P)H-hydrate dehydratase [Aeromicrobium yanjiei]MRK00518.1 NAD(P)H-hydrate dehydratase [Aeromicrobium sp. S22]QGG42643.1 NAD(P)H-hydrate dehydratase [Aeromicrobium yanjiei]
MSDDQAVTLTPGRLRSWPLPRPEGDKSSRGTVLVLGGSRSTPGAVLLAGIAALRAGAGKLQLATTESTAAALSIAVPEALVVGLPETERGAVRGQMDEELEGLVRGADVVLIGPGLVDIDETGALLEAVMDVIEPDTRLVVDAYALGALSQRRSLLQGRKVHPVLTPNTGEGARLLDRDLNDDLDEESIEIARTYDCVVSLFGHVADPSGSVWREETADSGLGTSGSGDAAAGVITGLLARGAEPAQAASWGVYVHAAAGQRLSVQHGRTGYLAREIVDGIAPILAELEG